MLCAVSSASWKKYVDGLPLFIKTHQDSKMKDERSVAVNVNSLEEFVSLVNQLDGSVIVHTSNRNRFTAEGQAPELTVIAYDDYIE